MRSTDPWHISKAPTCSSKWSSAAPVGRNGCVDEVGAVERIVSAQGRPNGRRHWQSIELRTQVRCRRAVDIEPRYHTKRRPRRAAVGRRESLAHTRGRHYHRRMASPRGQKRWSIVLVVVAVVAAVLVSSGASLLLLRVLQRSPDVATRLTDAFLPIPDQPIVDSFHRFRLELPEHGWNLLDEAEVASLHPDALAGGAFTGWESVWLLVFCDPHELVLGDHARSVATRSGLPLEPGAAQAATHHGFEAARVEATGLLHGRNFVANVLAFRRDNQVCAALAVGSPPGAELKRRLDVAVRSLVPLSGAVRDRPPLPPPDGRGVAWIRKLGVYANVASRLRIDPAPWCRIEAGDRAQARVPRAEALIRCRRPTFEVSVRSHVEPHRDPNEWLPMLAANAVEASATGERRVVTVRGRDIELAVGAATGEELLGGALETGGARFVQFVVAYAPEQRDAVLKRLPDVLSRISLLEDAAYGALAPCSSASHLRRPSAQATPIAMAPFASSSTECTGPGRPRPGR
jgi:hypothetical protein